MGGLCWQERLLSKMVRCSGLFQKRSIITKGQSWKSRVETGSLLSVKVRNGFMAVTSCVSVSFTARQLPMAAPCLLSHLGIQCWHATALHYVLLEWMNGWNRDSHNTDKGWLAHLQTRKTKHQEAQWPFPQPTTRGSAGTRRATLFLVQEPPYQA